MVFNEVAGEKSIVLVVTCKSRRTEMFEFHTSVRLLGNQRQVRLGLLPFLYIDYSPHNYRYLRIQTQDEDISCEVSIV